MTPVKFNITYCTGLRCEVARDCYRWTENLSRLVAKYHIDLAGKRIAVASFADHAGVCTKFLPLEDEFKDAE